MAVDADIAAAFADDHTESAPHGNVDPDIAEAFKDEAAAPGGVGFGRMLANAGETVSSGDFWRGAGRGVLGTFLSLTAGNQEAAQRETADYSHRWGLDRGAETQEGKTGQVVGGLFAPMPGGIAEGAPAAATRAVEPFGAGARQSISAAAASPKVSNVSPELQEAVTQATQKGGANMEAANRHLEAESLPVPLRLTKGQATQDPAQISLEMNNRSRLPGLTERLNEQNQALADNLQHVRDQVGDRVFSTTPTQHGDTLISAYEGLRDANVAKTRAAYQALADANAGNMPVDGAQWAANAEAQLAKEGRLRFLPSEVRGLMNEFRDGQPMTFNDFENARTILGEQARKFARSGDGTAQRAVSIAREQLESLPMPAGATAKAKQLADTARQTAKADFDMQRSDPAYAAVVNGTAKPDNFVNKYITGPQATRDGVARMKTNLAGNEQAQATMGVAAIDSLRDGARITQQGGNFSQYGYNRQLRALQDRMPHLLDPQSRETLETIGNVANYTQFQPKGSFVNNSNTTVAARATEFGKGVAEHYVNAKFGGLPVGSYVRGKLDARAAKAAADEVLKPGAGILDTSTRP